MLQENLEDIEATKLQKQVWQKLKEIPKGKVTTYKLLATAVGSKAIRAVASAVAKNPYAPKTPCHRVVLSSGKLSGYTHPKGVIRKIELLESEGIRIKNSKIEDFEEVLYRFER
jgi:O-6-methylguanine DNA methyltransferase